jgi:hypothetical protein
MSDVDLSGSGWGLEARFCEVGNEQSGFHNRQGVTRKDSVHRRPRQLFEKSCDER